MQVQIYYADSASPLGDIRLVVSETGLMGCYFHGQKYFPACSYWENSKDHPLLRQFTDKLLDYFAGKGMDNNIILDLRGSQFQQRVWQALLTIPYAQVTTYSELACSIDRPQAIRAVAAAIGRNPVSIIVPCHRVIGKNGSLTGYAGGLERKRQLLQLERQSIRE
jgi:methylated-DNA-[protein]-cysteine S-methyltransferase